jgi:hypothetical protein
MPDFRQSSSFNYVTSTALSRSHPRLNYCIPVYDRWTVLMSEAAPPRATGPLHRMHHYAFGIVTGGTVGAGSAGLLRFRPTVGRAAAMIGRW